MVLQFPSSIISVQDVDSLIRDVREYAKWCAHNAIKQRVGSSTRTAEPIISESARQVITAWAKGKVVSSDKIDELIAEIEQHKASAPTLTITLAAPPTNEIKQTLVEWCRSNIAPNALVSFRFNSTLLGGMVVRYGSRVFDWSFRRKILTDKAKFPEVLRNV